MGKQRTKQKKRPIQYAKVNSTTRDIKGRTPAFQDVSLLKEMKVSTNRKGCSIQCHTTTLQPVDPRCSGYSPVQPTNKAEMKYPNPDLFYPSECKFRDTFGCGNPLKKKLPPLSQLLKRPLNLDPPSIIKPHNNAWQAYQQVLGTHPIITKAMTSATVYTIGDYCAQRMEDSSKALDLLRMIRSMLAGLIGHGPLSHYWYNFSESCFIDVLRLTAWWSFIPKVAVDQAIYGPFWNNTYILLLGLMRLQPLGAIFGDMKRTTIPLVLSGLKLWPFVHCITYGIIPVENRVLFVGFVEILWVTILATQAAAGVPLF